jgi:GAF domain-containing protein
MTLCSRFVDSLAVTGASISMFGADGRGSTICASDELAGRLDELQFDLGEGPHWEVLRTRRPLVHEDLLQSAHSSWPVFGAAVVDLGVRALFAFPVTASEVTVGVVDLYRTTPGGLGDDGMAAALSLAERIAGPALRAAFRSAEEERPSGATVSAMRREVHQAIGMILVQLDTNAAEAFSRLRGHAFSTGRSVQDVARDVVARELDFAVLPE